MKDTPLLLRIAKQNKKGLFNKEMLNILKKQDLIRDDRTLSEIRKAFESQYTSPAIRNAILNITVNPQQKHRYADNLVRELNIEKFYFTVKKYKGTPFLALYEVPRQTATSKTLDNILSADYLTSPTAQLVNKLNFVKPENLNKSLKTITWINNYYTLIGGVVDLVCTFTKFYNPESILYEEDTDRQYNETLGISFASEEKTPNAEQYQNLLIDLRTIQKMSVEYSGFLESLGLDDQHADAVNMINSLDTLIRRGAWDTKTPLPTNLIAQEDFGDFQVKTVNLEINMKNLYTINYSLVNLSKKFASLGDDLFNVKLDDDFFNYTKFHWNSNPPKIVFNPISYTTEKTTWGAKDRYNVKKRLKKATGR